MERKKYLAALTFTTLLGLSGCVVDTLPPGSPKDARAITTPGGIFFKKGNENDASLWKHELQHWKDYMEDPLFFQKYATDSEFACEAEKRANQAAQIFPTGDHAACDAVKDK